MGDSLAIFYNASFPSIAWAQGIERRFAGYLLFLVPLLVIFIVAMAVGLPQRLGSKYESFFQKL